MLIQHTGFLFILIHPSKGSPKSGRPWWDPKSGRHLWRAVLDPILFNCFSLRKSKDSVICRPLCSYYVKPSPRFRALVQESVFHGVLGGVSFRYVIPFNSIPYKRSRHLDLRCLLTVLFSTSDGVVSKHLMFLATKPMHWFGALVWWCRVSRRHFFYCNPDNRKLRWRFITPAYLLSSPYSIFNPSSNSSLKYLIHAS